MSIQAIPTIRCDMVLTGSSGYIDEVTTVLQMKSTANEGDWRVSTGDVRCTCSDQVTAIIQRHFPAYLENLFLDIKRAYDLKSVMTLHIRCEASSFPFITLDEPLIQFLLSTDTELVMSISEGDEAYNNQTVRLSLNMSGKGLAFDRIETITGKTAWFKKRQEDFPVQVQNSAKDTWVYRTEAFSVRDLKENAHTFFDDFSNRGLAEDIHLEKCSLDLNIYGADGFLFENVIPRELLLLANQLSAQIWVGRYADSSAD